MTLFSELIQDQSEEQRRRLYALWIRAVRRGDFAALKLLDTIQITGAKFQPRQVADYLLPADILAAVQAWLIEHEQPPAARRGLRAEQARQLSPDELAEAIRQQQRKPRQTQQRKPKTKANKPRKQERAESVTAGEETTPQPPQEG